MWRPPERIRHALPEELPPTAEEAARSRLFSPLRLQAGLTLLERTWVPAMVPWRATEEGFVSPEILGWYGRFAEGEPGVLVVEATGIRDVPSGPLLRIGHDRFVPGLARLVEEVRRRSGGRTRLFIQLIDFLRIRRRPERERYLRAFLVIGRSHRERLAALREEARWEDAGDGEVREALCGLGDAELGQVLDARELEELQMGARERVTDVHVPEIRDLPLTLPSLFAGAAARAKEAGFDGVELHYAHAYTMASLLSARNTREDGYGGPREARARLPLAVYRAVREAVGSDYVVGCRFLCDDVIEGGNRVEDAAHFGVAFAQAGMDFLSLSTGGKFEDAKQPKVGHAAYPYTGPSGYECMPTAVSDARGPFGRQIARQAAVRRAVREAGLATPTVAAGGLCTFAQAEGILERGEADLIGAARQTLADPDWFLKLRLGRGGEVRRCIYSNYCEGLDQLHKAVTCQLWDREDLEAAGTATTDDGRRRLVAPSWSRPRGA
ncbi:oxidoreductase [Chondromyces apiculatus]|uniref:2,4-dienoyl-CoA reductase n=1 Tax=Chondromyces apiculatus DSM 436 TaxID=1192034 RepID=A0A017SVK0_9BACT|nr:NADH oxidase [Chondromyces apiculatus]EYF00336.1 2,4-dienoyl-CoA reductase [Chondromyces apiculatus DSM 436]